MKWIIIVAVTVVLILIAYKKYSAAKRIRQNRTDYFVCDVCKGNICECHPENKDD
jgi:hypothetical protein